ncbi:hypothetical protein L3V83_03775 [Thiotrichales bacterium 19X7-9]|nr:hypothetical protein [Thiotrichales bacterium 19X7-9]
MKKLATGRHSVSIKANEQFIYKQLNNSKISHLQYERDMCNLYYEKCHNKKAVANIVMMENQFCIRMPYIEGIKPSFEEMQQTIINLAEKGFYMADANSSNFIKLASGEVRPIDFGEMLYEDIQIKMQDTPIATKAIPREIRQHMLFDYNKAKHIIPKEVQMDYSCAFSYIEIQAKVQQAKKITPKPFSTETDQQNTKIETPTLD